MHGQTYKALTEVHTYWQCMNTHTTPLSSTRPHTYWQCPDGLSLPKLVQLSEGLTQTQEKCGMEDETRLVSL